MFRPSFRLYQYDLTIVHGGTNEININRPETIVNNFETFAEKYEEVNPDGWLGYSCMIPKPCGGIFVDEIIQEINQEIIRYCDENRILHFRTYGIFSKNGKPDCSVYKYDLLHPSIERENDEKPCGAEKMQGFFNHQLSDSVLLPRARRLLRR